MTDGEINDLIAEHRPFARRMAQNFYRRGLDIEDLEQEAMIGLWEAAKEFESRKNPQVPFRGFARPFVVRRLGSVSYPEATLQTLPEELPAPVELHSTQEGIDVLLDAMDHLTLRERRLVIARYWLGLELGDVCAHEGFGYRRGAEILQGARTKLRAELLKRGFNSAGASPFGSLELKSA